MGSQYGITKRELIGKLAEARQSYGRSEWNEGLISCESSGMDMWNPKMTDSVQYARDLTELSSRGFDELQRPNYHLQEVAIMRMLQDKTSFETALTGRQLPFKSLPVPASGLSAEATLRQEMQARSRIFTI